MINYIYIDGNGHKAARAVKNREEYFSLRNSVQNRQNLMLARDGDEKAKMRLVQFNYNDILPDGVLKGCCHPASTFVGDIDCNDQKACAEIAQRLLDLKQEIGLMELSRSARFGLHYVCLRKKGTTILENQVRVAMLTKTEMDTSTHDLQRVMFTVTADDKELLFLDDRIFQEPLSVEESAKEFELLKEREIKGLENVPEEAKKANKHFVPMEDMFTIDHSPLTIDNSNVVEDGDDVLKDEGNTKSNEKKKQSRKLDKAMLSYYQDIPYSDIIDEWWKRHDGEPQHGNRNDKLHQLAVNLRAVCENRKDKLIDVLPCYSLSKQEHKSIVTSASKGESTFTLAMKSILEDLKMYNDLGEEIDDTNILPINIKRKLPIGLKESLIGVPPNMQMPVLCAIMPIAATYADQVRVTYCDGMEQRLGLMSIIIGDQASGKSICKEVVDFWKKQMKEDDALARQREDEWKERNKGRKANERAPEAPKLLIRLVPVTISCSKLLKRFKISDHTLYSFCEELDTLVKTNGAGSWSAKYDIYRLAFDRGEWGQDFNSDQAESGLVNVAYNWTILGTIGSMQKCFRRDNVENGLSGRILVSEMSDGAFAKMPKYGRKTTEDLAKIVDATNILKGANGLVDTPRLRKAIDNWVEEKRVEAAKDIDRVKDTYRRRSAVIGFRCGVIFHLLSGNEKESQACINFALMMADYCLNQQIKMFGETLSNQYVSGKTKNKRNGSNNPVFDQLPPVFTTDDVRTLKNGECGASALRMILFRWLHEGWIIKIGDKKWQKASRVTRHASL